MRIRDLVKSVLLSKGCIVSRPPGQFSIDTWKLAQAKKRGLDFRYAVDGGAATGTWARELREVFPQATVLCIEPRDDAQTELKATAQALGNVMIAQTLVGEMEGVVRFHRHGAQSSILPNSDGKDFGEIVEAPITTLDKLVALQGRGYPDFIKLDLQGAELSCLRGATECLKHVKAVQLELSFLELQKGMPLFAEAVGFMATRGMRIYDVFGLWHRPLDGALAQGDFFFVRDDSPLLADRRWSDQADWNESHSSP